MGRTRNESSEHEDDPEPFENSDSDPEFDVEEEKIVQSGRRKSSRAGKKRSFKVDSGSDDEDIPEPEDSDSMEEAPKRKKKASPPKRGGGKAKPGPKSKKRATKKVKDEEGSENEENEDENGAGEDGENSKNGKEAASTDSDSSQGKVVSQVQSRGIHRKFIPKTIFSEDYATGSFVVLKKDAHTGPENHPCIWRIDGKALLQKYEAFDEEEKVRHKNTSIYTGWSPLDKDLYAPITVDVVRHNNNNLTVEVHWDKLKDIQVDSE